MDGVPYLSQPPIEPGARFRYEFDLLDAGTYWYHPHLNSSVQLGRGLHGVLIVDEAEPPEVDRDVVWVLDDWRLDQDAQLAPFAGNMHDASHGGRIGNVVTVNGSIEETFEVTAGERVRLRLVNVANARSFALRFDKLRPWLMALDGQPVAPAALPGNRIELGAGQRTDLIIDMVGEAGSSEAVIDDAYGPDYAFKMMQVVYAPRAGPGLAGTAPPLAMAANPIAEPDLATAQRHQLVFEGGAMGGLQGAMLNGSYRSMRDLVQAGKLWAINGKVGGDAYTEAPLLDLELGQSYTLELVNRTAFPHPIHLHGHGFRVISQNGAPITEPPMRDTVLLRPDQRQVIAFVADNPGLWMLHCHILEHQEAAMMGVVSVT
jgi:FtsP/CotA-like multicopper oxidase with cupredoxin domain